MPICKHGVETTKKIRCPDCERNYKYRCRYGIEVEDYDQMFEEQGGRCAICGTNNPKGRGNHFQIDHNHETGEVRGLLCYPCNHNLGRCGDSPDYIKSMLAYLEKKGHYGA